MSETLFERAAAVFVVIGFSIIIPVFGIDIAIQGINATWAQILRSIGVGVLFLGLGLLAGAIAHKQRRNLPDSN